MPTFDASWNELISHLDMLDALLAQKFVNRAWRDIRDHRAWGFLIGNGWLYSPPIINSGAANVTQFSQTVVLNTAASTAVTGLSLTPLTLRQFRVAGGPIYSIIAADFTAPTAVQLTLDRIFLETTNAAANYTISRIYYGPPLNATGAEVTDFLHFTKVYDPVDAYSLMLNITAEEIDISDPQRASSGQPYWVATRGVDSNNQPLYELWPSPAFERGYLVLYQKRGVDLVSGDSFPPVISEEMVLERALYQACVWAGKQTGPRFIGVNWRYQQEQHLAQYRDLLHQAEKQDEEAFMQNMIIPEGAGLFPIDSAWIQSHGPPVGP